MEYISYNVGTQDFPDIYIYACALGPAVLGLGHIYQANPSCPCYNYYIILDYIILAVRFYFISICIRFSNLTLMNVKQNQSGIYCCCINDDTILLDVAS